MSRGRQPYAVTTCAAAMPPIAEPMVKPQNINVTSDDRRRFGQYSDVSVMAVGMAPPSPRPVRKRSAISVVMSGLNARRGEGDVPRVDVIYYPEHAKLRVTITASPDIAAGLMRLVHTLLED